MKFDVYVPFFSKKQNRWCPGIKAIPTDCEGFLAYCKAETQKILCEKYQGGDAEAKKQLPAICWTGRSVSGERKAEKMEPTQFFMVDIDHIENIQKALEDIVSKTLDMSADGLALLHVTPSGKGLRFVCRCTQNYETVIEHMEWFCNKYGLQNYGDFDTAVKDLSRLSFLPPFEYVKFMDLDLLFNDKVDSGHSPIKTIPTVEIKNQEVADTEEEPEVYKEYKKYTYKGNLVTSIIKRYLEVFGTPEIGERHNYYNSMVKNFRCITDNNPQILHALLPRFGNTFAETLSQCQSICRTNTLSRLPKDFYFFLKDNGFYQPRQTPSAIAQQEEQMSEAVEVEQPIPPLPPVFKQFCGICPPDFVKPTINALMPIIGTLTSYLRTTYPIDGRGHSTSFFSVVYAPPSSGKSYATRLLMLLDDLKMRDLLNQERENLYNRIVNGKGSNEKSPNDPHVTVRYMTAITSQPELLCKMRDNKGYHMFTFVEELDTWAKGSKAGGSDKSDLIRVAWDNGEYGQSFKSGNTFKGIVNLYWNVLITGTPGQLDKYFADVENGLVTRCGYCEIPNQEFADVPVWKTLTKKDKAVIQKFMDRCDENTYTEPLDFDPSVLYEIEDENFDKEVPWRYSYRPFKQVDMNWIMPVIKKFLKEQLTQSVLDRDHARDSFRKRAAVRGFRLGLMCTALWPKITKKEQEVIKNFVAWWMREDLKEILRFAGEKYNQLQQRGTNKLPQRSLFDMLDDKFTKSDLYTACQRLGIKTKLRRIIFDWKNVKAVEYTNEKDVYVKVKKK